MDSVDSVLQHGSYTTSNKPKIEVDVIKLIDLVKERPCIWDVTSIDYKLKHNKDGAWQEITTQLVEDYDQLSKTEKRLARLHIKNRWTNMRDAFKKSLKKKSKMKYLHHDQLSFIIKVFQLTDEEEDMPTEYLEEIDENISFVKQEFQDESSSNAIIGEDGCEEPTNKKAKKEKRFKRNHSVGPEYYASLDIDNEKMNFINVPVDPIGPREVVQISEDEAFFSSVLPTVSMYNQNDKLEFRIGVLKLMKEINEKKQ